MHGVAEWRLLLLLAATPVCGVCMVSLLVYVGGAGVI